MRPNPNSQGGSLKTVKLAVVHTQWYSVPLRSGTLYHWVVVVVFLPLPLCSGVVSANLKIGSGVVFYFS